MTLELEKLASHVEQMAVSAAERRKQDNELLQFLSDRLTKYRFRWDTVNDAIDKALDQLNRIRYHSARPFQIHEPLDLSRPAPTPLNSATIVACDGSQIMPSRHNAFLYSLINVGVFVYYHGQHAAPFQETFPSLSYPGNNHGGGHTEDFVESNTVISVRRDLAEIETLIEVARQQASDTGAVFALLDQRLLYWAMGASENSEVRRALWGWQDAMSAAYEADVLLAGYVVRPTTHSVITMLRTLDIEKSDFEPQSLLSQDNEYNGLTDAMLFREILGAGERSCVFIDVSQHNTEFAARDENNEVCFFYLNPSPRGRQIARVDIPRWVAEDPQKVALVHALVYNQCQIMGDYPYVLARADELAVVGYRDKESLDIMIENAMQRYGLAARPTAKQGSKNVARAGRTRHGM